MDDSSNREDVRAACAQARVGHKQADDAHEAPCISARANATGRRGNGHLCDSMEASSRVWDGRFSDTHFISWHVRRPFVFVTGHKKKDVVMTLRVTTSLVNW